MHSTDIAILYQDHHLLLLNKPAGIVIHPTYKHGDGDTLWDALLLHLAQQEEEYWQPPELPDEPEWLQAPPHIREFLRARRTERLWQEEGPLPRPCLLHRLDKDTSGIVALARTERARRYLARQFHEHTIVKRYLAIVQPGSPEWAHPHTPLRLLHKQADGTMSVIKQPFDLLASPVDTFVIDGPLQRDPVDRRRCIVGPEGRDAMTSVRVLCDEQSYVLLEVQPITGRTHQIRAHLAALGYGIVGDQTYALPAEAGTGAAALHRQFLHAYSLTARYYPDYSLRTFVAPLPDELTTWMAEYFPTSLGVLYELATASLEYGANGKPE
jgi:23S rRNA pseudouridine1911/1915/1917 synthase